MGVPAGGVGAGAGLGETVPLGGVGAVGVPAGGVGAGAGVGETVPPGGVGVVGVPAGGVGVEAGLGETVPLGGVGVGVVGVPAGGVGAGAGVGETVPPGVPALTGVSRGGGGDAAKIDTVSSIGLLDCPWSSMTTRRNRYCPGSSLFSTSKRGVDTVIGTSGASTAMVSCAPPG